MFDLPHILYISISTLLTVGLLTVFVLYLKDEKQKRLVLKISAISTVILHYSGLYVDYFTQGYAEASVILLLPVYPCHIAMWFLLVTAFLKDTKSRLFKRMAEATFYLGVAGGIIGIILNENYASNPNLADWDILKGLLSHSTMLLGCLYLLVGKFIKIRVDNVISATGMLLFLLLDGVIVIGLHRLFGLNAPNCMYLLQNPYPQFPWLNTWLIGSLALALCFVITAIYEELTLKKEERWYSLLFKKAKKSLSEQDEN